MIDATDPARRRLLTAGATLAATALAPEALWAAVQSRAPAAQGTRAERAILAAVCNLLIPHTDTPGAAEVGVPAFALLAVAHRLAGATPGAVSRAHVELDRRAGAAFLGLNAARRHAVLAELDAEAYSPRGRSVAVDAPAQPGLAAGADLADWRALKHILLLGYYTTEVGATRELRYQFVPGRYDPDVPFSRGERALMNDWWGNTF